MAWTVRPVDDERQAYFAGSLCEFSVDNGHVTFFNLPVLKEDAQAAMHFLSPCQNEQPGGIEIKTMHNQSIRVIGLNTPDETVLFVFATPWYRKQAAWFVGDNQRLIGMDQTEPLIQ